MQQNLPWIIALIAVALMVPGAWLIGRSYRKKPKLAPLPTEWNLVPRPVFSTDERRVYRQLREALPHHIVLSKLPMVRFCQPNDPEEVRYWYDLLGNTHVTFAICSANGRVLAAIDLDTQRGSSRRSAQIKQSVLGACRVRYLRCPVDHMPSIPELQLLVPHSTAARGPQPASNIHHARGSRSGGSDPRRRDGNSLWRESSVFNDSFFNPDSRSDSGSMFGSFGGAPRRPRTDRGSQPGQEHPDDIVGIVVDTPRHGGSPTRH